MDMIARKLPAEHARTRGRARLKKAASQLVFHAAVCALGIVMIYPLLWMDGFFLLQADQHHLHHRW